MDEDVVKTYGDRLRLRVCGLCWRDDGLLMVNHRGLTKGDFWAPPGGGVEFGEKVSDRLVTEFKEETNLDVRPGPFLFACEYINAPIHAVELFFQVTANDVSVTTGKDPELNLITDVRIMSINEILALPADERHGVFQLVKSAAALRDLTGFFTI